MSDSYAITITLRDKEDTITAHHGMLIAKSDKGWPAAVSIMTKDGGTIKVTVEQ